MRYHDDDSIHPFSSWFSFRHLHGCHPLAEQFWSMMRHRGGRGHERGRGLGHFGGGFMGGAGFDDHGLRTGRKLSSGDLQLLLLALLAEKPSHGYELIKALEERSGGFYSPSPGMIYPALTYLEEVGHATVQAEGAKKLYSITEQGRQLVDANREVVDTLFTQLQRISHRMDRLRRAIGDDPGDDAPSHDDRHDEPTQVWLARRELKRALLEKRHASGEESRRIAEILRRAAAEILAGS